MVSTTTAPVSDNAATPWLTPVEVAAYLRTSAQTVRKYISNGALPAVQPGGGRKYIVHRDDLMHFLDASKRVVVA